MFNIPFDELLKIVVEKSSLSEEEVLKKVDEKLDALAGLISRQGALQIVANELGVKVLNDSFNDIKVKDLKPGMRNVTINLKILDVYDTKEYSTSKGSGKLKSFLAGDETGKVRVVFWNSKVLESESINKDDIVRLSNLYVRQNNNFLELHSNNDTNIIKNPENVSITINNSTSFVRKKIVDITKDDFFVEVFGTIVQVYDPFIFKACNECNRKLKENNGEFFCDVHGKKEPVFRGILNLYVDDSSKALRTVFFDENLKKLLEEKIEVLLEEDKKEEFKSKLLGSFIIVRGRIRYSEQYDRLELVVSDFVLNPDPEEELKKLVEQQ